MYNESMFSKVEQAIEEAMAYKNRRSALSANSFMTKGQEQDATRKQKLTVDTCVRLARGRREGGKSFMRWNIPR
jgi:hypothetical protein